MRFRFIGGYIFCERSLTKQLLGAKWGAEVMDVTGWLGGYNFQWCWSSGFVAGQWV
ncbi:hypothetical protein BTN99_17990 [Vibrio campbellii]|nr:hypothetical protein BTN99_17990 [Vibrio campbellii]